MNEADASWIRSVLDRFVGSDGDVLVRVTFETGEAFILRYISEEDQEVAPEGERDWVGTWCGSIVDSLNVNADRSRFFRPGSAIMFYGSEITKIEDELTGEVLFSRGAQD